MMWKHIRGTIAKIAIHYHANRTEVTNLLGTLGLISDEKWERRNADDIMAIVNKWYPYGTGGRNWFEDMKSKGKSS